MASRGRQPAHVPEYLQSWISPRPPPTDTPSADVPGASRPAASVPRVVLPIRRRRQRHQQRLGAESSSQEGPQNHDQTLPNLRIAGLRCFDLPSSQEPDTFDVRGYIDARIEAGGLKRADERRLRLVRRLLGELSGDPTETTGAAEEEALPGGAESVEQVATEGLFLSKIALVAGSECDWCSFEAQNAGVIYGLPGGVRIAPNPTEDASGGSRICTPCSVVRLQIIADGIHSSWMDSHINQYDGMGADDPLTRRHERQACDVCSGLAAEVCTTCPLMLCSTCRGILDGCGGSLDGLVEALGIDAVKSDACLMLRAPSAEWFARASGTEEP